MNDVLGAALTLGRIHRVQHQFGPQMVRHRPTQDLAALRIEHDGKVEEPRRHRHITDVGDQKLPRPKGREVAIDQVRRGPSVLVAPGRRRPAMAVARANQPGLADQPRNPFAALSLSTCPPPVSGIAGVSARPERMIDRLKFEGAAVSPGDGLAPCSPASRQVCVATSMP